MKESVSAGRLSGERQTGWMLAKATDWARGRAGAPGRRASFSPLNKSCSLGSLISDAEIMYVWCTTPKHDCSLESLISDAEIT